MSQRVEAQQFQSEKDVETFEPVLAREGRHHAGSMPHATPHIIAGRADTCALGQPGISNQLEHFFFDGGLVLLHINVKKHVRERMQYLGQLRNFVALTSVRIRIPTIGTETEAGIQLL